MAFPAGTIQIPGLRCRFIYKRNAARQFTPRDAARIARRVADQDDDALGVFTAVSATLGFGALVCYAAAVYRRTSVLIEDLRTAAILFIVLDAIILALEFLAVRRIPIPWVYILGAVGVVALKFSRIGNALEDLETLADLVRDLDPQLFLACEQLGGITGIDLLDSETIPPVVARALEALKDEANRGAALAEEFGLETIEEVERELDRQLEALERKIQDIGSLDEQAKDAAARQERELLERIQAERDKLLKEKERLERRTLGALEGVADKLHRLGNLGGYRVEVQISPK